jgi:GNAT superfamily N-acetyltransferase
VPARNELLPDTPTDRIELIDLRSDVADPAGRRTLCTEFFESIYRAAFPKLDQGETPDVWLPLIDDDHPPPHPILRLIIARARDADGSASVVGGIVIEYFRRSRAALATYLAVAPRLRGRGLGRRLLACAVETVCADNGGPCPLVFAEVERPEAQSNAADRRAARARLAIMAALGARRLEFTYIQPRLGVHQKPLEDLMLVLLAPSVGEQDSVPTAEVQAFLEEFFGSLGQRDTAEFERVLRSTPADRIPLKDLRCT